MLHPLVGKVTSCIPPWHSECPLGAEPARVGPHCQELPGQSWCSVTALPLRLGALPHSQVLSIHPLGRPKCSAGMQPGAGRTKLQHCPAACPASQLGPGGCPGHQSAGIPCSIISPMTGCHPISMLSSHSWLAQRGDHRD